MSKTFDDELNEIVQRRVDNGEEDTNMAAVLVVKAAAIVAAYDNEALEQTAKDVFDVTLKSFKSELDKVRNATA